MVASNIKVFLRIRPSASPSKGFSSVPEEGLIAFEKDKEPGNVSYTVDNTKTVHRYRFDGILGMSITQEDVFNVVAKPVIEDVLQGINGTIFAYGQTGSGKTFTITGGSGKYSDRGLIPRCISHFFQSFQRCSGANFQMGVSYLEIYNNDGFDLLVDRDARKLEDLPRVRLAEDEHGDMHLQNLSIYPVQTEEDALNHLFTGDTNRVVAETPMNDASTRSHCMFILWVQSTQTGSSNVRKAKLHLVDLAGSERVMKTGVEGQLRKEAVSINLSLHYLGQVIEALHSRSKGQDAHIPYRNSLMTSVLRDSLGGNCKTIMIGTAAVEDACIDETISTCRFATRVATIKNNASVNEELDPSLLIKKLKKEAEALKEELKLMSGEGEHEVLQEADVEECKKNVADYLEEADPEVPFVCGSGARFRECFRILRDIYWQQDQLEDTKGAPPAHASHAISAGSNAAMRSLESTVLELRSQVDQRDKEIGMLVTSLKNRSKGQESQAFIKGGGARSGANPQDDEGPASELQQSFDHQVGASAVSSSLRTNDPQTAMMGEATTLDRNKALEAFRKSVRRTEIIEENREAVLKLVEEAQALGEKANAVKAARDELRAKVEKARMDRALESSPRDPDEMVPPQDSPEIVEMLQLMAEHKRSYLQHAERMKEVKKDIEKFQRAQAENSQRLQRDFENWFATYAAQQGLQYTATQGHGAGAASQARSPTQRSNSLPAPTSPAQQIGKAPASASSSSARQAPASASPSRPAAELTPQHMKSGAFARAASSERSRPAGDAWGSPSSTSERRRPLYEAPASAVDQRSSPNGSRSGAPPRPPSRPSAVGSSSAATMATAPAPGGSVTTGDVETDQTIAAFYAAMAELGR